MTAHEPAKSTTNRTQEMSSAFHTLALIVLTATIAEAQSMDKRQYTLFNPTPRERMRELSADRPDLTETPFTVDAGHFQLEMDAVNYSYNDDNSIRTETVRVGVMNLKFGLCNRTDLQLILEPYTWQRIQDDNTGTSEHQSGFGDITTRVKMNLWGNDGGRTALALMPFITFPTSQDDLGTDAVEGGLIVPFAMELPAGWGMGTTSAIGCIEDADGRGHHPEFVNTIAFGHDIVGKLAGYVEFFSLVSTDEDARWIGSVDFGFTYGLTEDIQLDAGINIGVTSSADDYNPFCGMTWRF